jgi:hypothetical protein
LNESINLSLIDLVQYEISNLDAHMLIIEILKCFKHNEFEDPHEEIMSFSEYEDIHSLDANVFDSGNPHEHPPTHYAT